MNTRAKGAAGLANAAAPGFDRASALLGASRRLAPTGDFYFRKWL